MLTMDILTFLIQFAINHMHAALLRQFLAGLER